MTLGAASSASPATWITTSELPWHQLACLGPSGFDGYARLRFLPDPLCNGEPEINLDQDAPSEHELLRATLDVLEQHTRTPDELYFCLWDGWGHDSFPSWVLTAPRVGIPNREYFLVAGALPDFGDWDSADVSPGHQRLEMPDPAFIWPADQAWCIANDVDPHYAGIGATSTAVDHLLARSGLDVVSTDARAEQPYYL